MMKSKDAVDDRTLEEQDGEELEKDESVADEGDEQTPDSHDSEEESAEEDEELNTKYLRLAADFQNYRRRVEKEKNDIYAYANEKVMV
ncbi:MAG TPA: nucleotide exchange factor GrpE, partial [Anaerovoracaceae bacterium]|nr:nucleotide exchange factor GrpE [Anaerovoracaceae bacterium]